MLMEGCPSAELIFKLPSIHKLEYNVLAHEEEHMKKITCYYIVYYVDTVMNSKDA